MNKDEELVTKGEIKEAVKVIARIARQNYVNDGKSFRRHDIAPSAVLDTIDNLPPAKIRPPKQIERAIKNMEEVASEEIELRHQYRCHADLLRLVLGKPQKYNLWLETWVFMGSE